MSERSSKLRVTVREMRDGALMPCGAVFDQMIGAADEIDQLQAIVHRLPKTADGVPITPWMPVWLICGGELTSVRISWIAADLSRAGTNSGWSVKPGECYSTREAAEKARKPWATTESQ